MAKEISLFLIACLLLPEPLKPNLCKTHFGEKLPCLKAAQIKAFPALP
jgi:hypothetical protein